MKKAPLTIINKRFGSKEKLVKELKTMFDKSDLFTDRLNADKGLDHVANSKLLKLYDTAQKVKDGFTTRAKLTEDLLKLENRVKDTGLKSRYDGWGLPRLWDHYKSVAQKNN